MATAAQGTAAVGTIRIVVGDVKIIGVDGVARNAQVGDRVFAKEIIQTAANAAVQVQLESGRIFDMRADSKLALDDGVLGGPGTAGGAGAPAGIQADVASEQAALLKQLQGTGTIEGPATAAGGAAPGAGGTADGGGGTPLLIEQANSTGPVTSGFSTEPAAIGFPEIQPELLPEIEEEVVLPVASVSVKVEISVDVENPPSGGGDVDIPGDDDGDGVLVSGNVASLIEGTSTDGSNESRTVIFVIKLDKPFSQDVQVTYTISGGFSGNVATPDVDYAPIDGIYSKSVTIPAGITEVLVPINITQDHLDEAGDFEYFTIVISNAVNATINPDSATAEARIYDDDFPPVAVNDTNWGKEDAVNASGNVLQSIAHPGAPSGTFADKADTDTNPAETLSVTSVNGSAGNVGNVIVGTYGTLVLNANGTYNYTVNNSSATIQQLDDGETVSESFAYTITDGFNPQPAAATLTITVFGTNDAPTITAQTTVRVSEEGLAGANSDNTGSADTTNVTSISGVITVNDTDVEPLSVTLSIPSTALTSGGVAITWELSNAGHTLVGKAGAATIIAISIGDNGAYNVTLSGQIDHAGVNVEDDKSFNVGVTVSDGTASADGTLTIFIEDDSPIPTQAAVSGLVEEDNLNNVQSVGNNEDGTGSTIATGSLSSLVSIGADKPASFSLGGTSGFPAGYGTPIGLRASVDLVNTTTTTGEDDEGATMTVTLDVTAGNGTSSGLVTTDNLAINLYEETNGDVTGRVGSSSGTVIFAMRIDNDGNVTVAQYDSLGHNTDGSTAAQHDDTLNLTGKINAVVLVTDGDGDTATSSTDIGDQIVFEDDGPSAIANATVTLDEDDIPSAGGNAGGSGDADPAGSTDHTFTGTLGADFGSDGAGSINFSGMHGTSQVVNGVTVAFSWNGTNTLTANDGEQNVFQVVVTNAATGAYTVTLLNSLRHHTNGAADNVETDATFTLSYSITDGDGDSAIGALQLIIDDDTPVIENKSNLVYANALNNTTGGTGIFDYSIGADQRTGAYSASNSDFSAITLTGTVGSAISAPSVVWSSETATHAVFNVAFSYVANPTAPLVPTNATGTLTFDKLNGTYTLDLAAPIQSFTILSTSAQGVGFTGYNEGTSTVDASGMAQVVVAGLSSTFFAQFRGDDEGSGNLIAGVAGAGGNAFVNGELFSGTNALTSASGSAIGVSSDTMQNGEVLDMGFFTSNPFGNVITPTAIASGIFLTFDGFGSEDIVVILKLVNLGADGALGGVGLNTDTFTTKAIIVDNGDIFTNDVGNTPPAGFGLVLDNNDGAVIIESNDYNLAEGENWVMQGAQVMVSTEGITGTGINLNKAVGASGASTTFQEFEGTPGTANPEGGTELGGDGTIDGDVLKISSMGFITTTTDTQDANLQFQFSVSLQQA